MISVVIVLAVLGIAAALVRRSGRALSLATQQLAAAPADATARGRRGLESDVQALRIVVDRSVDAGRSER